MSRGIVSILRPDGGLVQGARVPDLTRDDLLKIYRLMVLNRRIDERMTKLQRQGRIGFYIGSLGEEAAILGSAFALAPTDWIVPCYRELGAALLRGLTLYDLFCQLFGNAEDKVKGRQMPNHYCCPDEHFTSISSPVGTQIPHAVGIAMAARISGRKEVALVYFGEGATSEGDFHVACNFAGVFRTPTIFFCRNNHWAISVPLEHQTASENIAVKASAYGFEGVRVDGNDVLAVYTVTLEAVKRARAGKGPTLIEALTYRRGAHSTSDDPRAYRDDAEVEEWTAKDPIERLKKYLISQEFWSEKLEAQLEKELIDLIQQELHRAEQHGPPPLRSLFEDVFDEVPWHLKEQYEELLKIGEHSSTGSEV